MAGYFCDADKPISRIHDHTAVADNRQSLVVQLVLGDQGGGAGLSSGRMQDCLINGVSGNFL